MKKDKSDILVSNRKAFHDYEILEKIECGIELYGSEVKTIRDNRGGLSGAYIAVLGNELWLVGSDIDTGNNGFSRSVSQKRNRKLLCHRKEIDRIKVSTEAKGLTAVPLDFHLRNGRIKLEIGIARGKKNYNKKEDLKLKDIKRSMER